jgi:lysozyme family protein
MTKFEIAYHITMKCESGYSFDENDLGGETYSGISRKNFPNWEGWKIIDDYKKSHDIKRGAIILDNNLETLLYNFYQKEFFDSNRLGEINNQQIVNELFDTGVNMGKKTAALFLQQSLNLLNRNQKDFKDIIEDGVIGNMTLSTLNNYKNPEVVVKTLNGFQFMKYIDICERNPSQENNFRGWLTRVSF